MKFSRDGNHTIRCVITEDEIMELGYTMEEILTNSAKTQEFMNRIFDMAEREFETKFDTGIKTVRADVLSDHTLSLTFSQHPGTEGMMEHLKDILSDLVRSLPMEQKEALREKVQSARKTENDAAQVPGKVIALFAFEELGDVMRYAKCVPMPELPFNQLYRFEDAYFLMVDMTNCTENEAKQLSALTDEYSADVFVGTEKRAFIWEHGKQILKERAIEQLREI